MGLGGGGATCFFEEEVPFFAAEGDVVRLGARLDAFGIGGADDRLDGGGVAEEPSEGERFGGAVFDFGEVVDGIG